jgi:DNA-binding PadR family transcriptional regulator
VTTLVELTSSQRILLAASRLEDQGQSPFSAEALIVASWQESPRSFGLKGYADQYPDSNRVLSCIMGEKGLAKRGWLVKMGQKLYQLSRKGREEVRRLLAGEPEPPARGEIVKPSRYKIPRDQEKYLLSLFASAAVQRYKEGLKREITFGEACKFWNIENLHGEELVQRMDKVSATLAEVDRLIGGGRVELSNGRSISKEDLDTLASVHDYLKDHFSRHLTLLRNRSSRN